MYINEVIRKLHLLGIIRRGHAAMITRIAEVMPSAAWSMVNIASCESQIWVDLRRPSCIPLYMHGSLSYSSETFFRSLAHKWRIFVDVGAHVGVMSAIVASTNPKALCVAFEPHPEIYEVLKRNCTLYPNIRPENMAVGEFSGTAQLFIAKSEVANSTTRPSVSTEKHPISVLLAMLDDYFLNNQLPVPDMIKVDVEGGEYEVLKGSLRLRNSHLPPVWFIEANTDFLRERGLDIGILDTIFRSDGDEGYHRFAWDAIEKRLIPAQIDRPKFRGNLVYMPPQRLKEYKDFVLGY